MWIRSLLGDCVNLDSAYAICVTTSYDDYRFTNHCVVYAEASNWCYPLWSEEIASSDGRDVENVMRRANMFVEALVNKMND